MTRQRFTQGLVWAIVFLLPWQTRWIYAQVALQGEAWEYGTLSVYAVEALIALAMFLRGRPQFSRLSARIARGAMVFLGACFLSISFAPFLALSVASVVHLIFVVMLLFLLLDERTDMRSLATAFVAGLIIPSLLAWWQVLTGTSPVSTILGLAAHDARTLGTSVIETGADRLLRAYGPFSHPNVFGGYLVVGLFVLIGLVSSSRRTTSVRHCEAVSLSNGRSNPLEKIASSPAPLEKVRGPRNDILFFILTTILLPSALVLTFSRSAWLGLAIGLVVWVVLRWRRMEKIRPLSGWLWLLACVSVFTTVMIFNGAVFTRFDTSARLEAQSIEERAQGYDTFDAVSARNLVTGVGVGGYTWVLAQEEQDHPAWFYQPVHNAYLLVFAELGMFGILALLFFLTPIARVCVARYRSPYGALALALGTSMLIIALFDHYLWSSWSGMTLVGFTLAIMVRHLRKHHPNS